VLLLSWPADARSAGGLDRWADEIRKAAARFRIPQDWIRSVMSAESGGAEAIGSQPLTSRAGAMGLMQLMPETWAEMRDAYRLGSDPFDPHDNILAGAAYLRLMYDRFGYPGLFAAYNAGPARYQAHLTRGRALPGETIAYVGKVLSGTKTEGAGGKEAGAHPFALFAVTDGVFAPGDMDRERAPQSLFAIRREGVPLAAEP
jgi:soluble lytic murein transglycosylase-like protein